jgi:hypothetical protein
MANFKYCGISTVDILCKIEFKQATVLTCPIPFACVKFLNLNKQVVEDIWDDGDMGLT